MKKGKKVLLISYYWPPSGGAGVHRWLRFSHFFAEQGIDFYVYCPKDAAWPAIDHDLQRQVHPEIREIRSNIFEPHKYLSGGGPGVGLSEQKKPNAFKRFTVWVRGNLFIPDSRVFWIRPSVKRLKKLLRSEGDFDCIISTGPPHSTHLIALALKKEFGIRWIADFRDPWTQIDFYEQLKIGKSADKKQHRLEAEVLRTADEIVTVSKGCAEGLEEIAKRTVHVISNGFTFPEFEAKQLDSNNTFTISHFGSMPTSRNPTFLWQILSEICSENSEFAAKLKLELTGTVDFEVRQALEHAGLLKYVQFNDPIGHTESIEKQRESALLLLIANTSGNVKGILTGKFFEYLGAKRPILATGAEDSDLEEAMAHTQAGFFATPAKKSELKRFLLDSFSSFMKGELIGSAVNLEDYNSGSLAKRFIKLL